MGFNRDHCIRWVIIRLKGGHGYGISDKLGEKVQMADYASMASSLDKSGNENDTRWNVVARLVKPKNDILAFDVITPTGSLAETCPIPSPAS
jgi:hypothetical protein